MIPQREVDVNERRLFGSVRTWIRMLAAVGGAPGREVKEVPFPLSVTLSPPKQEPDSTWTLPT